MKRVLIFHQAIAPYRVDFFNDLNNSFNLKIYFELSGLNTQTYNSDSAKKGLTFVPYYFSSKSTVGKIFEAIRIIIAFKPDVIISSEFGKYTIVSLLLFFLHFSKSRVVVLCDDSYSMVMDNDDFTILHKTARKMLLPWCNNVITSDMRLCKWYHKKYDKGLFFPIICKEERLREKYKCSLRIKHDIEEKYHLSGRNVYLYVGRLVKIKNVESVIKAYSLLPQDKNLLVVIGSGPEIENLKKLSSDLRVNVIFLGRLFDEELYVWYNVSKCFVLASTKEPFGAVTNEALLGGCYGLVSNKAGSSCLIEENKNGMTFNPYNANELAEKMKAISLWPEVRCGKDGLRQSLMTMEFDRLMDNLKSSLS